jgi:hypothetical protein
MLNKYYKSISVIILVLLSNIIGKAQGPAFDNLTKISELVNSSAEESFPLVSPDGQKLYFARVLSDENIGGKSAGFDIWISDKREDGNWGEAYNAGSLLNNKLNNFIMGFGNKRLYLLNTYKSVKKSFVAYSDWQAQSWNNPEIIPLQEHEINRDFLGLYMHPSEKIMLLSMNALDSYGKEDLYVMLKDSTGRWQKPINLGSTINSSGFEISPFLSTDTNKLYFSSDGHNGLGDADIYVSERLFNTWNVWSNPVNLGNKVNSEKFDAYFSVDDKGNSFFVSNRDGNLSDIFSARMINEEDSIQQQIKNLLKDAEELIEKKPSDSVN